jgi:hypothetical protein
VGPRAGLDRCVKSRLPPGFDPRTVQPVASRYTDYATRPTLTVKEGKRFVLKQSVKENIWASERGTYRNMENVTQ